VLEVGAGAGSAAEALLEELARRGRLGDLGRYDVTEPSPFFRRRAERELKAKFPGAPLAFAAADVDRPLGEQGLGGDYDLVLGVNVLHVAKDLRAALAGLVAALAPGGWLVAGECLRLFPRQPVPADVVFQLFESFVAVETDPELRPRHGFLEPAHWRGAFAAVGLAEIAVVPDVERIRVYYPRFVSGAVVGRRPTA
jgi:SAM-dependent methyltransferase